jgi:lipid II:glycine glycyltransferase (peptidoglycan interpeptide bridge formation enzyme)
MWQMKLVENRQTWDPALAQLPNAHVLQSWAWGDFKSRWGWQAERWLWVDSNQTSQVLKTSEVDPVAAAQILRRPIPRTPWSFLYVSKGPALDYADASLSTQVLADLELYARRARALFIKIDPDVPRAWGEPQPGQPLEPSGAAWLDLLARRGWSFSPEQIQFRHTVIIQLTGPPDDLLAVMKPKWRYNIRLAERRGVTIRPGAAADIPAFYQMYAETAARDGFLIRPQAYYRDVWQRFLELGQAEMLLATVEKEIVAGLILFIFGSTAWYMYGASTGRRREMMPNHLLQWAALNRAKARGCTTYDMWGAPDVFDESDRMWGVYRFKEGFGGQVRQGLGAFDYPVNSVTYWAFTAALPRLRALLRQRGEKVKTQ